MGEDLSRLEDARLHRAAAWEPGTTAPPLTEAAAPALRSRKIRQIAFCWTHWGAIGTAFVVADHARGLGNLVAVNIALLLLIASLLIARL